MAQNHVDVDALLEDYAWRHFKDIQSLRKTRLDDFKNLEREDVEFVLALRDDRLPSPTTRYLNRFRLQIPFARALPFFTIVPEHKHSSNELYNQDKRYPHSATELDAMDYCRVGLHLAQSAGQKKRSAEAVDSLQRRGNGPCTAGG
ncbi:hypothetical protein Tcan_02773 [Toxocara canis]|uniref:Uncharacterized protein n=1 Tax=Toxocara canis TaxID=6265 RepID=A0A0B2VJF3_TOXCA|nr:hypothetical protein Tcan_02773 [Toxocara canis]